MLAGDTGLEPVDDGVKVRCLTDLANPQSLVVGEGFEPSKTQSTDLQSAPFGHSGTPPFIFKYTAHFFAFHPSSVSYVPLYASFFIRLTP